MSESNSGLDAAQSQPYDAQQLVEEIAAGETKAPKVDLNADYEAAQEFSVSSVDQTDEGAEMAEAATAPKYDVVESEPARVPVELTADPNDYREMAKEVGPNNAVTSVSDELVQKALALGEPGQS